MKAETTYAAIKERYPKEIADIIAKLRKGKSIHKNAAPEDLEWCFDYGHQIEAYTFNEMISGVKKPNPNDIKDPIGRAEAWIARCKVALHAKIGRWWGGMVISDVPVEVRNQEYESAARAIEQEKNAKPLTAQEFNDLLRGGLTVVRIGK